MPLYKPKKRFFTPHCSYHPIRRPISTGRLARTRIQTTKYNFNRIYNRQLQAGFRKVLLRRGVKRVGDVLERADCDMGFRVKRRRLKGLDLGEEQPVAKDTTDRDVARSVDGEKMEGDDWVEVEEMLRAVRLEEREGDRRVVV